MANIHDYLYWRGDIPLDAQPLNEVDGLVLTRFAYMPFEDVAFGTDETIGTLCEKLKKLPADKFRIEGDGPFVQLLSDADRFTSLPVTDFVKDFDENIVIQFAAITIHLPDDVLYISYCGTDSTLVGWKEDFYMSFMEDVPAQKKALEYAEHICETYGGKPFRLGGHSKGGNLAIYTAVNLPDQWKEKLQHVSNFDGPGFPDTYIKNHDFAGVKERLSTFIPEESMIGRIHEHPEGFKVVDSIERGIMQHDIFSWNIEPKKMTMVAKPDDSSEIAYRAIQNMLTNTTPEERKKYVDRIFDLLMSTDGNSFGEAFRNLPVKFGDVFREARELTGEDHKEGIKVTATMVQSFVDAALSYHEEKLPDFRDLLDKFKA